jgi:hypothetical protein
MEKNKIFKTGKALLFITSSLLFTDACFAAAPARPRAARVDWTKDEDNQLERLVATHGVGKWAIIAKRLPGRTRHQCLKHWIQTLDPTINKTPWTPEEDKILIEGVEAKHGWTAIARELGLDKTGKHRTDLQCKNRLKILKNRAQQPPADQAPANPPPPPPAPALPLFDDDATFYDDFDLDFGGNF